MDTPLAELLDRARRELLDLTARNRLLNTPLGSSRSRRLDIVDARSAAVFEALVTRGRDLGFQPAQGDSTTTAEAAPHDDRQATDEARSVDDDVTFLPWPDDDAGDDGDGVGSLDSEPPRGVELRTRIDRDRLQKHLLRTYHDERALEEEQGVDSLFLALGFLEWYESASSDKPRFAPLLLIPVELLRRTVNARFRLKFRGDDIVTNLSLQMKLRVEHGIELPGVPDVDELRPDDYFAEVERIVVDRPRWVVHPDRITLWFFSFAKFLMFEDLDAGRWGAKDSGGMGGLSSREKLVGLLEGGFGGEPPVIPDGEPLDRFLDPRDLVHVENADGSQAAVIEEVRRGRDVVVQGPPGTGKSQTIVNLIATAVREGKSVLFVAEKMAALTVVKSRLDRVGLGDMCLELHSHKAIRQKVAAELARTLELGRPKEVDLSRTLDRLKDVRDRLNEHVSSMHTPILPFEVTPYQSIGRLCRLQSLGVRPLEVDLPSIETWSQADLERAQRLLGVVSSHLEAIGNPRDSAWWGVQREAPLLPSDKRGLDATLERLARTLESVLTAARSLATMMHVSWRDETATIEDVRRLTNVAARLLSIPDMDREAFADPVWETARPRIGRVVELCREAAEHRSSLNGIVAEVAWTTDVREERIALAGGGNSWLRWFDRRWWSARSTLSGLLTVALPGPVQERIAVLDRLIRWQSIAAEFADGKPLADIAAKAFGAAWQGIEADPGRLAAVVEWDSECRAAGVPKQFRQIVPRWRPGRDFDKITTGLSREIAVAVELLRESTDRLRFSVEFATGSSDGGRLPISDWLKRIARWRTSMPDLDRWVVFRQQVAEMRRLDLDPVVQLVEAGAIGATSKEGLEFLFHEAALRRAYSERRGLSGFDGVDHERIRDEFQRLDEARIERARVEVALSHFQRIPTGGDSGEVGTIRHEGRKKRRHLPIRRLLSTAGGAVQAIKPVFLMSPISVAQFLEPDGLEFDLLVIDEASQVRPVDALGAVIRSRQLVVVGDSRQLPPTAFFDRAIGGDDEVDDPEDGSPADVESILDLCVARNMQSRMLRWHYRSKHHSLIAVSNREFYDGRLFVVPSPIKDTENLGLQWHFVADGIYERGGSRTNRGEARAVAAAMIEHARSTPKKTLGVGTFSVAQRDAILDELELLRRSSPETEPFFADGREEPCFVKNLENIQGDERDVIFISVGYGRDRDGYFGMSFGPLATEGGERRLNVLITRARERCAVFSSIRAEDIDLRRARSRGVAALKEFLRYAETKELGVPRLTDRGFDSEFEADVAAALSGHGYQIETQVGTAGFFIDLAVVDDESPGRFLLGVECDGATYHSAAWARDRDRLRQTVLESHGWRLHRIWSTDWFRSRESEERRLLQAIERARLDSQAAAVAIPVPPRPAIDREMTNTLSDDAESGDDDGVETVPYVEAAFHHVLMEAPIPEAKVESLAVVVRKIVEIEGPVHVDEIARRATSLWGLSRTGSRISAAVERAVEFAVQREWLAGEEGFHWCPGTSIGPVRSREGTTSATLRQPTMIPPVEIRIGLEDFVKAHVSATRDEAIRAVSRMLGFRQTSQQIRQAIDAQIERLLAESRLSEHGGSLRIR